ncbi:MAG: zinc-dependent peptidase [Acidobacteria bacterium]|nr:zinc-dependent peptidase [Acidobacteriota bacterium]
MTGISLWILIPLSGLTTLLVYAFLTRKIRRRKAFLARPFPPEWKTILQSEVVSFRALAPEDRQRFRRELPPFLGEKRITGIRFPTGEYSIAQAPGCSRIPYGISIKHRTPPAGGSTERLTKERICPDCGFCFS